jgi:lipoyl(octanoyl) transferase
VKQTIEVHDLGKVDFRSGWNEQEKLFSEIIDQKLFFRENHGEKIPIGKHYLLLCEHDPVITLGRNGSMKNLQVKQDVLNEKQISFFKTNRGGDITFHGEGQLVAYPILDLDYFFTDIGKYLRLLEESVILTCNDYGIQAGRSKGETGVWIEPKKNSRARKICAIGIRCSRWVTMHGLAFNINTDLDYFNYIIPCGISDKQVTSLQKELGYKIEMDEVKEKWLKHFSNIFNAELVAKKSAATIS